MRVEVLQLEGERSFKESPEEVPVSAGAASAGERQQQQLVSPGMCIARTGTGDTASLLRSLPLRSTTRP